MKLLIDANIVLDVLLNRDPHVKNSSIIWKLCETKQTNGYITALTIANLIYVMRKNLKPDTINQLINNLSLIFTITNLTSNDLLNASALKWNDYEDSIQSVIAQRINADYIITRNITDFRESNTIALTPENFLTLLSKSPK